MLVYSCERVGVGRQREGERERVGEKEHKHRKKMVSEWKWPADSGKKSGPKDSEW